MPKTNPLKDALRDSAQPGLAAAGRRDRQPAPNGTTKLIGAHFPEPVHRQLRVVAAQAGLGMRDALAEALNGLFAKHKMPPIA